MYVLVRCGAPRGPWSFFYVYTLRTSSKRCNRITCNEDVVPYCVPAFMDDDDEDDAEEDEVVNPPPVNM